MPLTCIFRFFWLTLCPIMRKVKLFLTDVDGCLTDGGMYYGANGEEMKRFCVYDGMGIVRLQKAGIPCGILTSENTPIVQRRAEKLRLQYLRMGVGSQVRDGAQTKLQAAEEICRELVIAYVHGLHDTHIFPHISVIGFQENHTFQTQFSKHFLHIAVSYVLHRDLRR